MLNQTRSPLLSSGAMKRGTNPPSVSLELLSAVKEVHGGRSCVAQGVWDILG